MMPLTKTRKEKEMEKVAFPVAMKRFFGLMPGQTVANFAAELKALTDADRAEFKTLLRGVGFDVTP